jgi:hypothetical protein
MITHKATRLGLVTAALLSIATALPARAADETQIEGQYVIYGREMSGDSRYAGKVAISRQGTVYTVIWLIGNEVHTGTGLLTDNVFSVTFIVRGSPVPGLAVYRVEGDGVMTGQYTMLGGRKVGAEVWRPVGKGQEPDQSGVGKKPETANP